MNVLIQPIAQGYVGGKAPCAEGPKGDSVSLGAPRNEARLTGCARTRARTCAERKPLLGDFLASDCNYHGNEALAFCDHIVDVLLRPMRYAGTDGCWKARALCRLELPCVRAAQGHL